MFADPAEALRQVVQVVRKLTLCHRRQQILCGMLIHRVFVGIGLGHGPLRRLVPTERRIKDSVLDVLEAEYVLLLA